MTAKACLICPSCDNPCWRLIEGVCRGCHYCLTGGGLGLEWYSPSWTASLTPGGGYETAWWAR